MKALGQTLLQYQNAAQSTRPDNQPQERDDPAAIGVSINPASHEKAKKDAFTILDVPAPELDWTADPEPIPISTARTAPIPEPAPEPVPMQAPAAEPESVPEPEPEPAPQKPRRKVTIGEDGIITLSYDVPQEEAPPAETEEPAFTPPPPTDEPPEAAPASEPEYEAPEAPKAKAKAKTPRPKRPSRASAEQTLSKGAAALERLLRPVVQLLATKLAQKQLQKTEAENWPDPVDVRETPELSPKQAGKFYAAHLKPLRFRLRIAIFLCLILGWIALQFPMAGALGQSTALQAGVSLVLTLAVMVTALDVFAAGLRQIFDLHPGAEALAALACLVSCVDAVTVMLGYSADLPYCAAGAVSLTAALWAERLTCTALCRTYKTVLSSKTPTALSVESGAEEGSSSIVRSAMQRRGLVRRSEQPDLCQTTYAAASPILLLAALLLAILASLGGQGGYFLHTLSALLSVTASFAAFFAFPLPYSIAARRLRDSGVALAGYAGCADIGKNRRVVITDEDLFPPGTIKFSEINILEGAFVSKVVSCTASLLANSGSGVVSLFNELMTRRGYQMVDVEQFVCHEGGGLSGMVGSEHILVGSAGFMNLMGIRLPRNLDPQNAICTAIEGELVGVFTVEYIPTRSVQDALVILLRSKTQAVFALRDFNITPLMLRDLFQMPTDNFNFPSFRERYRMTIPQASAPLDAILTRSGMMPMVEAAESGRKLYNTCRLNTILSLVGTCLGLFIMFLLCRAGSFDTATAGNVLTFMLLWALPAVILSIGQNR
jgi:hypothetical protein